jgi:PAS domain S-box-containing protein
MRYVGTIADITDRKAAEEALRDSETRQRLAIDAARMAVWEIDVLSGTVSNSVELNRLFGFPDDARPTLEELRARYCPGERERVLAGARDAFAEGAQSYEAEFRCQRIDGEIRWLLLRVQPIYSADNVLTRAIGVVMDIDDRKRAEERQTILLRELNHRVKNSLAVIQAISAQTFRGRAEPGSIADFQGRLGALAKANDILLSADWKPFSAKALIERLLEPYGAAQGTWEIEGGDFELPPRLNVPLALVIHELATNAAKYGALSTVEGHVTASIESSPGRFSIVWEENGGPAVVAPAEEGFGTRLITQVLVRELAEVDLRFRPQGVICRISGTLEAP